jgi:hypothetical protein
MRPDYGVVTPLRWQGDCPRRGLQEAELALLEGRQKQNLLLIGSSDSTRAMLAHLMSSLAPQIVTWDRRTPDLATDTVGTLIVRDVARLTEDRQRRLLEWLNEQRSPARVIATSTRPFFTRVERGLFLGDLYYRLNTITVLLDRPFDDRRLVA